MNRFLKLLSLCLFLTLTVPLQAVTNGVANEPDSVYLFSYSHADGSGGLKLAGVPMATDGSAWQTATLLSTRTSAPGGK